MLPLNSPSLFGIDLIDPPKFFELLIRFGFNFVVMLVLVRYLYYSITFRKDYLFTFFLISTIVFLICFLLENVRLQLGFALGLFAIFGILRYRTAPIPIKEMTYLFVVIGLSVINALSNETISYAELLTTNLLVLLIAYSLEKVWLLQHKATKTIIYEKIELIKPEKRKELIQDLEDRTGLKIDKVEIGRVDFLRDTARIRIYYASEFNEYNFEDNEELNN